MRKRLRRSGACLAADRVLEMCTGAVGHFQGHLYSGYATGESTDLEHYIDAVRGDWARFGADLLPWLVRGAGEAMRPAFLGRPGPAPWSLYCCSYPGGRPWAWWQFDAPEPMQDESELVYLRRLALLLPGEEDAAARYDAKLQANRLERIVYQAEQALRLAPRSLGEKFDDPSTARHKLKAATAELSALQPVLDEMGPDSRDYWKGLD